MKKRFLAFFLCLTLLAALTACSSTNADTPPADTSANAASDPSSAAEETSEVTVYTIAMATALTDFMACLLYTSRCV